MRRREVVAGLGALVLTGALAARASSLQERMNGHRYPGRSRRAT